MMTSLKRPPAHPLVCRKKSGIHRHGVFAKKDIAQGTYIIEYVGEKITKKQSEALYENTLAHSKSHGGGAVYVFELNSRYDLNGDVPYNLAKYINHACETNCSTEIDKGHIWIIADKDIKKGEELLYNYGYDLTDWQEHPCYCGKDSCVGYIVEQGLRKQLAKKIQEMKTGL